MFITFGENDRIFAELNYRTQGGHRIAHVIAKSGAGSYRAVISKCVFSSWGFHADSKGESISTVAR
jgi:hypothetical protein